MIEKSSHKGEFGHDYNKSKNIIIKYIKKCIMVNVLHNIAYTVSLYKGIQNILYSFSKSGML